MIANTKAPEEQLHEATKSLPDNEKWILVGVARGMALAGGLPKTG